MNEFQEALIVDDDSDDQEIFLMCVNSITDAIICRTANNGVDALSLFESQKDYIPDYIFLDVNMPKMNGIECLRYLKAIDQLSHTKIFMYSTTSEKSVVEVSKTLGADGFIIKPASPAVLKRTLSEIFSAT